MKVTYLNLYTNKLQAQRNFYTEVLGLNQVNDGPDYFEVQTGWTRLRFTASESEHIYHYCFLIPSNQLHEAFAWFDQNANVVRVDDFEDLHHFESWNARAFYFVDGDNNIAECIVRYDLNNESALPFSPKNLLCVNEIGLPTTDVEATNTQLENELNTPFWKGNKYRFGTNGDQEGIFLLPNPELKPNWYPTMVELRPEAFEAQIVQNGVSYNVSFDGKTLHTQEKT